MAYTWSLEEGDKYLNDWHSRKSLSVLYSWESKSITDPELRISNQIIAKSSLYLYQHSSLNIVVTVMSLDHIVFPWLYYSGYILGDMTLLRQCDLLAISSGLWRFALHWNSEMMPPCHSVLHHNPPWHKWKPMTANRAQNMTAPVTIEIPKQRHKCTLFSLDKQERTFSTHTFHIFQITKGNEI